MMTYPGQRLNQGHKKSVPEEGGGYQINFLAVLDSMAAEFKVTPYADVRLIICNLKADWVRAY